jgi:hypothetical protein
LPEPTTGLEQDVAAATTAATATTGRAGARARCGDHRSTAYAGIRWDAGLAITATNCGWVFEWFVPDEWGYGSTEDVDGGS